MQDVEILIRHSCKKCGGDGAMREDRYGTVIGNCSECCGSGIHEEWVLFKGLDLIEKKKVNNVK